MNKEMEDFTRKNEREYEWIKFIQYCYNSYNFKQKFLYLCLAKDVILSSQWVYYDLVGRDEVYTYLVCKAKAIKRSGAKLETKIVRGNFYFGSHSHGLLVKSSNGQEIFVLVKVNEKNQLYQYSICMP